MSQEVSLPHHHGHHEKAFSSLPQTDNFEQVAGVFKQLSDPVRCRIFLLLWNMSSPAVAHHLRLLKYSGLVQSRRDGKEVFYRASDSDLAQELHHIIEKVMNLSCCND